MAVLKNMTACSKLAKAESHRICSMIKGFFRSLETQAVIPETHLFTDVPGTMSCNMVLVSSLSNQ